MDSFNLLKELTNLLEFSIWKCSLFFFCAWYLKLAVRFQQLFFGYLAMQSKIFFLLKHMCHCQRLLKLETNFSLLSLGQKNILFLFMSIALETLVRSSQLFWRKKWLRERNDNTASESSGTTSPSSTLDLAMVSSAMTNILKICFEFQ